MAQAGWYPQQDGSQRYFDGAQWVGDPVFPTPHARTVEAADPTAPGVYRRPDGSKAFWDGRNWSDNQIVTGVAEGFFRMINTPGQQNTTDFSSINQQSQTNLYAALPPHLQPAGAKAERLGRTVFSARLAVRTVVVSVIVAVVLCICLAIRWSPALAGGFALVLLAMVPVHLMRVRALHQASDRSPDLLARWQSKGPQFVLANLPEISAVALVLARPGAEDLAGFVAVVASLVAVGGLANADRLMPVWREAPKSRSKGATSEVVGWRRGLTSMAIGLLWGLGWLASAAATIVAPALALPIFGVWVTSARFALRER